MKDKTARCILTLLTALCFIVFSLPATPASALASAPAPEAYTVLVPLRSAADDLEERVAHGTIDAGSNDIELGYEDPGGHDVKAQIAGFRFSQIPIPPGAVITEAYIQFTVDEVKNQANPFDAVITAEDSANATPFGNEDATAPYALSSRPRTAQSVRWATSEENRVLWRTEGQAGKAQRTPDISALVQSVVGRADWAAGNAIAFFIAGAGNRTAVSYEGDPDEAAALAVSFVVQNEDQPAPEGLTGIAPATLKENDGRIAGTSSTMEYRPAGDETAPWEPCGDQVTGLVAGDYEVRFAARIGYNAGAAARVHLPLYAGDLTLQPGADETAMSITWYLNGSKSDIGIVQIVPAAAFAGGAFPEAEAQTFTGEAEWIKGGNRVSKVTVSGLAPYREYVYRVGNGENWSGVFRFATRGSEVYCAILAGDPQIGASGDTDADALGWRETVGRAASVFPEASFLLSVGDQVQCWSCEPQYEAFFAPPELRGLPLAPTAGNHDDGEPYALHFTVPNESRLGCSPSGGDYWFVYGNTLYMALNTNNRSASEHAEFLERAVAQAGEDVVWKIVLFHHSIYSSAAHSIEKGIVSLRYLLHPLMDAFDIDVALMGHDHCYTRTYQMLGGRAQNGLESYAVNPPGTLYVTTGSASASQFYPTRKAEDEGYRAVRWPEEKASYSCITVSDGALTIVTYRTDTNEEIDRYTIVKDPSVPLALAGVAPAAPGNGGRIEGTTAAMEYRRAPDAVWTPCADGATAGLAPGVYAVRYAHAPAAAAGGITAVVVPAYAGR